MVTLYDCPVPTILGCGGGGGGGEHVSNTGALREAEAKGVVMSYHSCALFFNVLSHIIIY